MVLAANKRSVMTLFSSVSDLYCHQTRIVLAEKGVTFDVEFVDKDNLPEDLIALNPYGTLPTFVDRDLALYDAHIIMEYLDERFPHPPLMPVYPVSRANSRLMMHRIKQDWYSSFRTAIEKGDSKEGLAARRSLRDDLTVLSPLFKEYPYFLSEEFSLIDCYMAPLLWRLPLVDVELSKSNSKDILSYMNRVFERPSFVASLTDAERKIRSDFKE